MKMFIDEHRNQYGVELDCNVLPIAPSTYRARAALGQSIIDDCARLAGRRVTARDLTCLARELQGLWLLQGLAATEP